MSVDFNCSGLFAYFCDVFLYSRCKCFVVKFNQFNSRNLTVAHKQESVEEFHDDDDDVTLLTSCDDGHYISDVIN